MQEAEFKIHTQKGGTMHLTQAVLIYQSDDENAFATVHNIDMVDGQPVILAGQAMTPRAACSLSRALSKNAMHRGFLPETVLYIDGDLMVWWVPPAERHIVFRAETLLWWVPAMERHSVLRAAELNKNLIVSERGERVPHPGLIFAVSGDIWKVWAVKGDRRPTLDTPLYNAPYFNVFAGGGICQGNVTVPEGTTAAKIDEWNSAFLDSVFTHPNRTRRVVSYRGGVYRFWQDMLNNKFTSFPEQVLHYAGMTLGMLLGNGQSLEEEE
jgi:PRTRC genetic system protein B